MRLHLIRHGETVTSGRTYAGRSDVALTARGLAQADAIAAQFGDRPIRVIVTSPLSRAVRTAAPLAARLGLHPVRDPALVEIDFGDHEGADKASLDLSLRKSFARTALPGGESLHDVWLRAERVLAGLNRAAGEEVAIVGHFWINRMIFGRVTGLDFDAACRSRDYRPVTGSAVTVDWHAAADG